MFVFGGIDPERSAEPGLLRFDTASGKVDIVAVSGERPNAIAKPALVYDAKRDALFLFGGWARGAKVPDGKLWTLALGTETPAWRLVSESGPPARNGCVMVLDSKRDRLLVHGGDGGPHPEMGFTPLDDLWSYDLAAERWTQLTPTGDVPSPRWNHSGAIDDACNKLYIFGGAGYTSSAMVVENDVYELDLAATAWRKLPHTSPAPTPVQGATLTHDPVHKVLVLVGGVSLAEKGPPGTKSVWVFDLDQNRWTETPDVIRIPRREHTAIYDARSKQHLIYGGEHVAWRGDFYARGNPLRNALLIALEATDRN
ncbi:MAG: hypothetical protein GX547_04795 [Phycisphaerae bacterium]|nr:hypothetical protein [Phycisphaerae bacterium]